MARIIVLDSGPLGGCLSEPGPSGRRRVGLLVHPGEVEWRKRRHPQIAGQEVRRGLLFNGALVGLVRLDRAREELGFYIPISTMAMRRAAELWADARRAGVPTADEREIDADVILAAEALLFAGLTDDLMVATYNERHLARYLNASHWRGIIP